MKKNQFKCSENYSSFLSIFVKPALKRGLNPVGLLVAVCSVVVSSFCWGSTVGLAILLPVGVASGAAVCFAFGSSVGGSTSCVESVFAAEGTTVDGESVLAVLVKPALNLGLKPVGFDISVAELIADSAGEDVFAVTVLSSTAEGVVASSTEEFAD